MCHILKAELLDALACHRQADQAAPEARHEIDRVRIRLFGRNDEIALVLAALVIDKDEHAAVASVLDDVFDGGQEC